MTNTVPIPVPKLLVSVRSAEEAQAALRGGCELLDVKEPDRGALGMADVDVIAAVIDVAASWSQPVPVSAALGEVVNWRHREIPALPAGLSLTKLGAASLGDGASWLSKWQDVCRRFEDESAACEFRWIAAAYADWKPTGAPAPAAVIAAAIENRCAGVLIDTGLKTSGRLFDWLTPAELAKFAQTVHERGLLFAVAGSLTAENLSSLAIIPADVVAIRSAACIAGQRTGQVDAAAVQTFKSALRDSYRAPHADVHATA